MNPFRTLRESARRELSPSTWRYIESEADESGAHVRGAAWDDVHLVPRMFRGVSQVSTAATFGGQGLATPVLVSPTGAHGLCHPGSEVETARGAALAGALFCYSSFASTEVSAFADEVTGPWWAQVYPLQDAGRMYDYVDRCASLGAAALVLTVDNPGRSAEAPFRRDVRGRMAGSPGNFPGWGWDQLSDAVSAECRLDLIGRLFDRTGLPIHVKGILHPLDAVAAVDAGAAAVVVSNHGGRQLAGVIPTALALPVVADAVAGRVPVHVDGGIRSGTDVLRALTLGASGVGIGRPVLWALATGGSTGVAGLLRDLTDQLAQGMAAMGIPQWPTAVRSNRPEPGP